MHGAVKGALKTALITGAASGLGRAIALLLARDGWIVVATDIDLPGAQRVAERIVQSGGHAISHRLDVTSPQEWLNLRDTLRQNIAQLDLLVNNAGIGCAGEVGQFSLEDWQAVIDINLRGAINGCHTMIDWLKANPRGAHIANVASIAAIASGPTMAAYNATKAGVISLSETLYVELRRHGIGVTVVCPGFFPTNILANGRFCSPAHRSAAELYMRQATVTAEQVAAATLGAIERKQLYVVLPLRAKGLWWLKRFAPRTLLAIFAWHYARSASTNRTIQSTTVDTAKPALKGESPC
jgi:NAD(P)-dependent dehydrogenase (short-subunit alcohol dehydrogenase family)